MGPSFSWEGEMSLNPDLSFNFKKIIQEVILCIWNWANERVVKSKAQ